MSNEFVTYRKFTDISSATSFAELLKQHHIDFKLQDNNHAYVKVVGYHAIDLGITLNIKSSDFEAADKILKQYYVDNLHHVDGDYYIFGFSNEELKEIVDNPYDWGQFDLELARKLLKDKGIEYSDSYISERQQRKLSALSQIKKVPVVKLIAGYLLSIFLPIVSILIGLTIIYNRNLLPDGEKFYVHSPQDRTHGWVMIGISITMISIIVFRSLP